MAFPTLRIPLDVSRYCQLLDTAKGNDYPSLDEIAIRMGEMLCRQHWLGGYDGHDVMGRASLSGLAMDIIDFNLVYV